jgi:hypothetical protein
MRLDDNPIKSTTAKTAVVEIFMAGPIEQAKNYLSSQAAKYGACWSIEPVEFIYTGGRESGFVVRSINYPRFPKVEDELMLESATLAEGLLLDLHQSSCSVVGPNRTLWLSRRGNT